MSTKPWNYAIATGVIIVTGTWGQQATYSSALAKNPGLKTKPPRQLTYKQGAAAVAYIFLILGLDAMSPELAEGFAILVLITAVLEYATPVFQNLGVIK